MKLADKLIEEILQRKELQGSITIQDMEQLNILRTYEFPDKQNSPKYKQVTYRFPRYFLQALEEESVRISAMAGVKVSRENIMMTSSLQHNNSLRKRSNELKKQEIKQYEATKQLTKPKRSNTH